MRNISLCLAALCATSIASAHDLAAVRKVLNEKNADFIKAMKHHDVSWFKKVATPSFVDIVKGRKMTLDQSMAQMKQMFEMTKHLDNIDTKIVSLKMQGKEAVAVTDNLFVGTIMLGPNKTGKLVDKSREEEIWTPVGKDWKIRQVKTLTEKATVDGKPFPM